MYFKFYFLVITIVLDEISLLEITE